MIAAWTLLLAALFGGQDDASPETAPEVPAILLRTPHELPVSEPGAWKDWDPRELPEVLRPMMGEFARSYRAGELPVALGHLFEALEAAPDYPACLHQGGVIYFKLRRYGDAQELFERFCRVAPESLVQTRALGHCYYSLGEYDKALEHYARILELDPTLVEARRGLALSHFRTGEPARALEELERVVAEVPTHADAWTWIAQIHYDEDRTEEALTAVEEALAIDAFEPRPWFLKTQVLWDLDREEDGDAAHARFQELSAVAQEVRFLEARLALDPHQLDLLQALVQKHGSVGNFAAARQASSRILIERRGELSARVWVLDALDALGDREGATAAALAVEEAAGDDAAVWQRLSRFWRDAGDRTREVRAAERYLRLKYK